MSRPDGVDPLVDIKADRRFMELHEECDPYTMTPIERQYALYEAITHIHYDNIPGDIVECGVWRGGSMLLAAKTLALLGGVHRNLWLFDTYNGMTPPGPEDINYAGELGDRLYSSAYLKADLNSVRKVMSTSGYPKDRIRYVEGNAIETTKGFAHSIALLRLDTDFYDSTKAELQNLYPMVVSGGIVIIDDAGHWQGSGKAMKEYFYPKPECPHIQRIDYSARLIVKP